MEKSISPIAFCGTLPLYAHKIVKFSEAFEEDAILLLDRFLCVLAFPLPNDDLFDHRIEYLRCQLGDVHMFLCDGDELFCSVCLILYRIHLPFKYWKLVFDVSLFLVVIGGKNSKLLVVNTPDDIVFIEPFEQCAQCVHRGHHLWRYYEPRSGHDDIKRITEMGSIDRLLHNGTSDGSRSRIWNADIPYDRSRTDARKDGSD